MSVIDYRKKQKKNKIEIKGVKEMRQVNSVMLQMRSSLSNFLIGPDEFLLNKCRLYRTLHVRPHALEVRNKA